MMMNQYPAVTDTRPSKGRRVVAGTLLSVIAMAGISACDAKGGSKPAPTGERVSQDYLGHIDPNTFVRTSPERIEIGDGVEPNDCFYTEKSESFRGKVDITDSNQPNDANVDAGWAEIPLSSIENQDIVNACAPYTDTVYVSDRYIEQPANITVE